MAGRFNPDDYEPVEDRIRAFWADHPYGQIISELLHQDDKRFVVKAVVNRVVEGDYYIMATGLAEETVGGSPVNRTHALENCETSAIGRALANAGYATKGKRPSREEMQKSERLRVTPAAEARDELRRFCEKRRFDMNAVAEAYQRLHDIDVRHEDDHARIRKFTADLVADPQQYIPLSAFGTTEEVKE